MNYQIDTADICEIAHTITAEICEAKGINVDKMYMDGSVVYTEKAQKIFTKYFDLLDNTFRN